MTRIIGARHSLVHGLLHGALKSARSRTELREKTIEGFEKYKTPKNHAEKILKILDLTDNSDVVNFGLPEDSGASVTPEVDASVDEFEGLLAGYESNTSTNTSLEYHMRKVLDEELNLNPNQFVKTWRPFTYEGVELVLCATSRYRFGEYEWNIMGSLANGRGTIAQYRSGSDSILYIQDGHPVTVTSDFETNLTIPGQDKQKKHYLSKLAGETVRVRATVWLWALRLDANKDLRFWLGETSNGSRNDLRRWPKSLKKAALTQ